MKDGKTLYTKRCKKHNYQKISEEFENSLPQDESEEIKKFAEASLSEFQKMIHEEKVYVEIPERTPLKKAFINKIIEFAEYYEIDADIIEYDYFIKAYISFDVSTFFAKIQDIIALADDIDFQIGKRDRDITIGLTCYTHKCSTVSGKTLYPVSF